MGECVSRARVLRRDCRILGDLQRRVHSPLSLSSMRGALLHSRDGCCAGASWGAAIHLSHFSAPTDRSNTEPLTRGLLPPPSFGGSRMMQQQANRLGQERKGCMGSEIVVRGSQGSCAGASFPRVLQPPRACPSRPPRATAPLPSDPLTTSARLRSDHGVYFWFATCVR